MSSNYSTKLLDGNSTSLEKKELALYTVRTESLSREAQAVRPDLQEGQLAGALQGSDYGYAGQFMSEAKENLPQIHQVDVNADEASLMQSMEIQLNKKREKLESLLR